MSTGPMQGLRSRGAQYCTAALAAALLLLATHLLPHLTVASTPMVELREAVLLFGSIALMVVLVRVGPVPATAMGWRRPALGTLGWGLLCLVIMFAASGAMIGVMKLFGISQNAQVLGALVNRPAWLLVLLALTAAVSEEIVARGIILNYVAAASGRLWIGAAVSLAFFALAHVGGWGWTQVVFAAVPGAILTLFFVWKRDLGVCILAHFLTDSAGLLSVAASVHHQ